MNFFTIIIMINIIAIVIISGHVPSPNEETKIVIKRPKINETCVKIKAYFAKPKRVVKACVFKDGDIKRIIDKDRRLDQVLRRKSKTTCRRMFRAKNVTKNANSVYRKQTKTAERVRIRHVRFRKCYKKYYLRYKHAINRLVKMMRRNLHAQL